MDSEVALFLSYRRQQIVVEWSANVKWCTDTCLVELVSEAIYIALVWQDTPLVVADMDGSSVTITEEWRRVTSPQNQSSKRMANFRGKRRSFCTLCTGFPPSKKYEDNVSFLLLVCSWRNFRSNQILSLVHTGYGLWSNNVIMCFFHVLLPLRQWSRVLAATHGTALWDAMYGWWMQLTWHLHWIRPDSTFYSPSPRVMGKVHWSELL
jgi:hypothetical protein